MTSSRDIRSLFLSFFQRHGHEVVRSSPLLPHDDPTLLFTNAGMNQFKDVFTGRESRACRRATSSQKCVRAGGKHNDLENVGRTARHHTFFEMLGNFSFGDYFKEEAIVMAWDLLVREYGMDPGRMVVTVFGGEPSLKLGPDDEARAIWRKVTGFGDDRILGLGMKDNFWMMGDTGPQGPCSEIHYYNGEGAPDVAHFTDEPTPDGKGWMEIWNLVFMQFHKETRDAALAPLPRPSIDTGAGLERICAVLQGVRSNYDCDLLRPLVDLAAEMAGKRYGGTMADDDVSMRVLADHARAATFLIADGVMPSNEGRGYVLRRIMRRAIRHGVRLGLAQGRYRAMCDRVVEAMGGVFPEIVGARALIDRAVDAEDETFRRTIDRGLRLIEDNKIWRTDEGRRVMPGEVLFKLYDTYGFPPDLTRVIGEEQGFTVDEAGFEAEMAKQRARCDVFGGSGEKCVADVHKALREELGATNFVGYERASCRGKVLALVDGLGRRVERAATGERVQIVVDQTPFYGESGGQVGDAGEIAGEGFLATVSHALKPGGDLIVHAALVERGEISVGGEVTLRIDEERRDAIRANHSATHLLHWALRTVLGTHVTQKGSLVAPDRLRFDFAHFAALGEAERHRIEDLVNQQIRANQEASVEETSFEEARRHGAMALFGEKYGERVRMVRVGESSTELCGGTHVRRTGDIGAFKLVAETGIAQGVRRIEALTGAGAVAHVRRMELELEHAAGMLRGAPFEVVAKVERLQRDIKDREKEIEELRRKIALGGGRDLVAGARDMGGYRLLVTRSDTGDPKALREVAEQLRDKLGSGVVIIGGAAEGKVALVAAVSPDLVKRFQAGKIIAGLAPLVGGKGGGRPDLAQGGGTQPERLDEALERAPSLLA